MKLLKSVTILAVAYATVYFAGAQILKYTGMSYRAWVAAFEKIIVIWVLPLLGIIWTGVWLKKKGTWGRAVKIILLVMEAALYACWSYFGLLVFALSFETEKAVTSHLLATGYGAGFGEAYYVCERPIFLFFKVPGALTEEDEVEYLEEKYGREFGIDDAGGGVIYDTEFPEVGIHVYFSAGSGELRDDYVKGVLNYCLSAGMEELAIDRECYISEYNSFHINLEDESDIPGLAKDASELIDYVCKRTDLFEENAGHIYFYCEDIEGIIPFGRLGTWDGMDSDYYLYPEKLEGHILAEYEAAVENKRRQEEYQKEWEEQLETQVSQEAEEEYVDPIETNAKIIYDAVLEKQGYSCEVCYNAKGNLYLDLGSRPEGEAEDQYNTGTYRFTLVYDRISKNGACELFVLYKEHYTEEESGMSQGDGAAILDMYAVEVDTGKVVAADKQSWSDVGTREYRELTGE